VIAQGPADGRAYSLAQGPYRLRVEHGDCPDEWEREIEIVSGEERHYSPRLCQAQDRWSGRGHNGSRGISSSRRRSHSPGGEGGL
jgi:hypothetical protein